MPGRGVRVTAAAVVGLVALGACSGDSGESEVSRVIRDTLADGTPVVRYPALPIGETLHVAPELRLGTVEDDPNLSFGDVRGIDAGRDGTIYVLDYLASEVRAFDAEGRFLRLVASKGEGPGEISEANGMILVGDSILWIQDHGKWTMLGLTPEGEEVARVPMHVRSYSYMWNGTVDDDGRFWKPTSHTDEERTFPPDPGLAEGTGRAYWKVHDPAAATSDSVYMGESRYRTLISQNARGGWSYRGIPFEAGVVSTVDPAGGFWQAHTGEYRIARLDAVGDTTLVVTAEVAPTPVTEADRTAYMEEMLGYDPEARAALEEVVSLMPETKPVIARLSVDELGRLWVGRVVPEGETPLYDVFDANGTYLGSVKLGFQPNEYLPIRVRNGELYTLVLDDLDIPFVVRAPVPSALGASIPTESAAR